jgi:hypothetical protein
MNNSGYIPRQPSKKIDCNVPRLNWSPSTTATGFDAHLTVPWSIIPNVPTKLLGSVWRVNFYRWDHGLAGGGGNASAWSVTYCDQKSGGCNPEHVPKYFGTAVLTA